MASAPGIAIIGAGYAGMAAATELVRCGLPVTVFEASRVLGGRARAIELHGVTVDNGQHILIGAYRETLRLLRIVGTDARQLLLRLPLSLDYPGEFRLKAAPLPAPLHLAAGLFGARGLSLTEKLAAIRFMRGLKRSRYHLVADCSVAELLAAHQQPSRLREFLWQPLCLAALNTAPEHASAQVFINVLRDSLAADRHASDLMLPRVDLGALFPDAACRFLQGRGGRVRRDSAIRSIACGNGGYRLHEAAAEHGPYSQVIVAVAPYHLPPLLAQLPALEGLSRQVASLDWEPIVTCYLAYPANTRLIAPMLGHSGGTMQWLVDRGQLGGPAGLLAAVISAHGRHQAMTNEALAAQIHTEIEGIVPALPSPLWSQVITEKRATFACVPGLIRPATQTAAAGLWIAGDYVASDYPATLEAAVRSGINAARSVIGKSSAD